MGTWGKLKSAGLTVALVERLDPEDGKAVLFKVLESKNAAHRQTVLTTQRAVKLMPIFNK